MADSKAPLSNAFYFSSHRSWFYDQLRDSKKRNSKWKLIGQQILFTPLSYGEETFPVNYDAWDGYNANR